MLTEETISGAIDALPGDDRPSEAIFQVMRDVVERTPAAIEEIWPGMELSPRQMTRKEIANKATKASVARKQRQTDERYAAMVPLLKSLVDEDPNITLAKIRTKLVEAGFKPLRSQRWNRASILYMMNRAGLWKKDES
jgi:hypothetical protein